MILVEYQLFHENDQLDLSAGKMYRYIMAANGLFVYSRNEFFEACMPITPIRTPANMIRGLGICKPKFRIASKVPTVILKYMVDRSRSALPNEILFYLSSSENCWGCRVPSQWTEEFSVKPASISGYVPIEVHSHNTMPAFFSGTDNQDEVGLRIYGVLGHVDRPVVDIKMRVSIFGHRAIIPYRYVFESYSEVQDAAICQ